MNKWSTHPNAESIDRIFESAKKHPELWKSLDQQVIYGCKINDREENTWHKCREIADEVIFDAVFYESLHTFYHGGSGEDGKLHGVITESLAALVTYTDCAYMLDSAPEELAILAKFGDPRAILTLSAAYVFAKEKELK